MNPYLPPNLQNIDNVNYSDEYDDEEENEQITETGYINEIDQLLINNITNSK